MTTGRDSVSTESRLTRLDRLKVGLGLFVAGWLIRLLVRTYRVRVVSGSERVEALLSSDTPTILVGWHEGLLAIGTFLLKRLVHKGFRLALLISLSRDGELLARVASRLGMVVVRGSTSRGGLAGLRRLYRMLAHGGSSVGLAPDGPRGPARECKAGALLLAQISGAHLLPLGTAADRTWRLRSWDRMIVPKPFARVVVIVGESVSVPKSLSGAELESQSRRLAATLDELTERAQAALES